MRCLKNVIYVPPPVTAAGFPYMGLTVFSDVTFGTNLQVLCHNFNCFIYPPIYGMEEDLFIDAYS
jgi:hypothetical protein